MPKPLFYIGVVCCVFLALSSVASVTQQLQGVPASFVALRGRAMAGGSAAAWAIVVALLAAVGVAPVLRRLAAPPPPRDLFCAGRSRSSRAGGGVSLSLA